MAHTSLQVCMDSSDWLQGTMSEEISTGLDSSSSPSGGTPTDCMLVAACSSRAGPPLMERRLRPPHDQNLKCPRCDSTHTKFCYYNNYSLSQPRYFCKTCRRYWTKGGTLRNIPVGGGCRKNKKSSSSKKSNIDSQNSQLIDVHGSTGSSLGLPSSSPNPIDLQLSFPNEVHFPAHLAHLIGAQMSLGGGSFMEGGGMIRPIDFMESKYGGGHDFMGSTTSNGSDQFGLLSGIGGYHNKSSNNNGNINNNNNATFGGIYSSNSPFGVSTTLDIHDGNSGISFMEQRLLLPFDGNNDHHHQHHDHDHDHDHHGHHHHQSGVDLKPNSKLLSLEWQDQGCATTSDNVVKDSSFGYNNVNGTSPLNSWGGLMGGFQSPTTNSLV